MKPYSVFLLAAALSLPAVGWAQRLSEKDQAAARTKTQATKSALAEAAAGNLDRTEQSLFAGIKVRAGTPEWHLHAAGRLQVLATEAGALGDLPVARSLGERALAQLALARGLAASADRRLQTDIELRTAFIHERLGGTKRAALEAYRAALALAPESKEAMAGISRLRLQVPASKEGVK